MGSRRATAKLNARHGKNAQSRTLDGSCKSGERVQKNRELALIGVLCTAQLWGKEWRDVCFLLRSLEGHPVPWQLWQGLLIPSLLACWIYFCSSNNNHRHSKTTTHGMQGLCRTIRNRVGTDLLYQPVSLCSPCGPIRQPYSYSTYSLP